jgi:hypothetical protein
MEEAGWIHWFPAQHPGKPNSVQIKPTVLVELVYTIVNPIASL